MLPNTHTHAFFCNTSRLGLEQASSSTSTCKRAERKTKAERTGLEWDAVTVTRDHPTTPQVKCNYCSHPFSGGATHIRKNTCSRDELEKADTDETYLNCESVTATSSWPS